MAAPPRRATMARPWDALRSSTFCSSNRCGSASNELRINPPTSDIKSRHRSFRASSPLPATSSGGNQPFSPSASFVFEGSSPLVLTTFLRLNWVLPLGSTARDTQDEPASPCQASERYHTITNEHHRKRQPLGSLTQPPESHSGGLRFSRTQCPERYKLGLSHSIGND